MPLIPGMRMSSRAASNDPRSRAQGCRAVGANGHLVAQPGQFHLHQSRRCASSSANKTRNPPWRIFSIISSSLNSLHRPCPGLQDTACTPLAAAVSAESAGPCDRSWAAVLSGISEG